jgi:hypothetical protein
MMNYLALESLDPTDIFLIGFGFLLMVALASYRIALTFIYIINVLCCVDDLYSPLHGEDEE